MKTSTSSIIRFIIVVISTFILGYGWFHKDFNVALFGSLTYLIVIVFDLFILIEMSKDYKKGKEIEVVVKPLDKITQLIEGILVISALITVLSKNNLYSTPSRIIWFAQVFSFAVVGPILSIFTNIPMQMTYGGWRVKKTTRQK